MEKTLLIPVSGSIRSAVYLGDMVIVRRRKIGLIRNLARCLDPFKREEIEVSKLIAPGALTLLANELKGAEVFRRVRITTRNRKGEFAYIAPLDGKGGFEIYRGKTEREVRKKAVRARRFPHGGFFVAISSETIAEIIETAESP